MTTPDLPADLHPADVHTGVAQHAAQNADHAGLVLVPEEHHVVARMHLDLVTEDVDELLHLAGSDERAGHGHDPPIGEHTTHGDEVAIVDGLFLGDQPDLDTALRGDHRSVDVRDRLLHHVGEHTLECG